MKQDNNSNKSDTSLTPVTTKKVSDNSFQEKSGHVVAIKQNGFIKTKLPQKIHSSDKININSGQAANGDDKEAHIDNDNDDELGQTSCLEVHSAPMPSIINDEMDESTQVIKYNILRVCLLPTMYIMIKNNCNFFHFTAVLSRTTFEFPNI